MSIMGGFTLYGPTHVFEDDSDDSCFCVGYSGDIDAETETKLLTKRLRILDPLEDLSVVQRTVFFRCHLPEVLSYSSRVLKPGEQRYPPMEKHEPKLDVQGLNSADSFAFASFNE